MKTFSNTYRLLLLLTLVLGSCRAWAQDAARNGVQLRRTMQEQAAVSPSPMALSSEIEQDLQSYDETSIGVNLRGIVVRGAGQDAPAVSSTAGFHGVRLEDPKPLHANNLEPLLAKYLGKPISARLHETIRREIHRFYAARRFEALVPTLQQDARNGVLRFEITLVPLKEVRVQGNKYFRKEVYTGPFRDSIGAPLDTGKLIQSVASLNNSSFRSVSPELALESDPPGSILKLVARERFPLSAVIGFDNLGQPAFGEERLSLELNAGALFGWDHSLGYRLVTPLDPKRQMAHALIYTLPSPLGLGQMIEITGLYTSSKLDGETTYGTYRTRGEGWQLSANYAVSLPAFCGGAQALNFGMDYKRTNNTLEFGGETVSDTSAETIQFNIAHSITWQGNPQGCWRGSCLTNRIVISPGDLTKDNTDAVFQELRPGASADYAYWRGGLASVFGLPESVAPAWPLVHGFTLSVNAEMQGSTQNLLPAEALALGGEAAVRGFEENAGPVDNGFIVRAELSAPEFPVVGRLVKKKGSTSAKFADRLRLYSFVDFGVGANHRSGEGEPRRYDLSSFGVGGSYRAADRLVVDVSYGRQWIEQGFRDQSNGRAHIKVAWLW